MLFSFDMGRVLPAKTVLIIDKFPGGSHRLLMESSVLKIAQNKRWICLHLARTVLNIFFFLRFIPTVASLKIMVVNFQINQKKEF